MRYQQMVLTPAEATKLLRGNTGNRPPRPAHIAALVRDIKGGRYKLNPQPIIVARSGRVIDGQHRLFACVESGIPIPVIVCWDAAEDVQDVVDRGRVRRASDDLAIDGRKNVQLMASAARNLLIFERGMRNPTQGCTSGEVREVIGRYHDGFAWLESVQRKPRLSRGSYFAVLVLCYAEQRDEVEIFNEQVQLGVKLEEDEPAYLLRDYLLRRSGVTAGWEADRDVALKTAVAFEHAVAGVRLRRLIVGDGALIRLLEQHIVRQQALKAV